MGGRGGAGGMPGADWGIGCRGPERICPGLGAPGVAGGGGAAGAPGVAEVVAAGAGGGAAGRGAGGRGMDGAAAAAGGEGRAAGTGIVGTVTGRLPPTASGGRKGGAIGRGRSSL